jgi:hypothetical protein
MIRASMSLVTRWGGISVPLPTTTARIGLPPAPCEARLGIVALAARWPAVYRVAMLVVGDEAPDFAVGTGSLHRILSERGAVVFFFPKAFTAG